jgi:uncharacterized alpha-E superfamily protein
VNTEEQALTELLSRPDFVEVPVQQLISAAKQARRKRSELHEFTGRLIATLNRDHGMTFAEIGKLLEMPHSTAHHMAKKYM